MTFSSSNLKLLLLILFYTVFIVPFLRAEVEEVLALNSLVEYSVVPVHSSPVPAPSPPPAIDFTFSSNIPSSGVFGRFNTLSVEAIVTASSSLIGSLVFNWNVTVNNAKVNIPGIQISGAFLTIPAGTLSPATKYTINLQIIAQTASVTHSLSFLTSSPPTSGSIVVNPTTVTELTQNCTLSTTPWKDNNPYSLTYMYYYQDPGTNDWISLNAVNASSISTVLPGNSSATIQILVQLVVTNIYGDFATSSSSVTVKPLSSSQAFTAAASIISSLNTSNPNSLSTMSVVASALVSISNQSSQAQVQNVITQVLTLCDQLVSNILSTLGLSRSIQAIQPLGKTNAGKVGNVVSVSTSRSSVITQGIHDTAVSIISKIVNLAASNVKSDVFSNSQVVNQYANVANNLALQPGYQNFSSDVNDIIIALGKQVMSVLVPNSNLTTIQPVYGMNNYNLVTSNLDSPIEVQSSNSVATITLNQQFAPLVSGATVYIQSILYDLPVYAYPSSSKSMIVSPTVTTNAFDSSLTPYSSTNLKDLYTVSVPLTNSGSTLTCRYYSQGQWDTTTCDTQPNSGSTVTCSCSQFGSVVVTIDKSPSGNNNSGSSNAGGIAAAVIIIIVVIVLIIIIVVVAIIVWYILRKRRVSKALGTSKDITAHISNATILQELEEI
jgi:hypothetical protein